MKSAIQYLKRSVLGVSAVLSLSAMSLLSAADDTIKVGVLHSLSGTMAISETTLKDTMLMLIEEQNKKGGLLGKKLEAVVVDPASNWPLFAEKARELIEKEKLQPLLVAGPPFLANLYSPSLKNSTAYYSTLCNTKVKNLLKTYSTRVLRLTNKRFQPLTT